MADNIFAHEKNIHICIIGLGYVGLPLAVEFGKILLTTGFDLNVKRVTELNSGKDATLETTSAELQAAQNLEFTTCADTLISCNIYIVTVPTPIDQAKRPDLTALRLACETVGHNLSENNIVIFESTVYPGATEEVCIPILEAKSGLTFNQGFYVGYSPERINPGDKEHRLTTIKKITSGSTSEAAEVIDGLYQRIVQAGTHKTSTIRVAEAAKVIENTQRDVNIALINEFALIFNKLGIDTLEVLEAAGSKWNFLPFRPGLVGGHCIGVDPYYLTHKAQEVGYNPEIVLAGRRINDNMGVYIAEQLVKLLSQKRLNIVESRILILGVTFKENCPDIRNSRVFDLIEAISGYNAHVDVFDPWVNPDEVTAEMGLKFVNDPLPESYQAVVVAVAHRQFLEMGIQKIRKLLNPGGVIFDIKSAFPVESVDARL